MLSSLPWSRKIEENWTDRIRFSCHALHRPGIRRERRGEEGVQRTAYIPASTVSSMVKPSLQTFRWVRVTISSMPWRVNSSLHNALGPNRDGD